MQSHNQNHKTSRKNTRPYREPRVNESICPIFSEEQVSCRSREDSCGEECPDISGTCLDDVSVTRPCKLLRDS